MKGSSRVTCCLWSFMSDKLINVADDTSDVDSMACTSVGKEICISASHCSDPGIRPV